MEGPWINTDLYTVPQLVFYLGGFALWGLAYGFVVWAAIRRQFVEVPAIAVCGNVTWEFLWGFVWTQDMGRLLQFMYMAGCLLDIGILFYLFRYGHKQLTSPAVEKIFRPALVAALLGFAAFWYFFKTTGYDLPLGSNSAYLINFTT